MAQGRFGAEVAGWAPPARPEGVILTGRWAQVERLEADLHAADLHRAFQSDNSLWDYMPYGPFGSSARYHRWVKDSAQGSDPLFHAIRDLSTGHCGGVAAWLRIAPEAGSIEVGHICLSPELQRGRVAAEALFLMMDRAFAAGYRRYEWKCDALNQPSRRAACRLGFSYEGTFRQAAVVKGRNRDTAWFAIIDADWPALREAWRVWLDPQNFRADGTQRERLSDLTALVGIAPDPGAMD